MSYNYEAPRASESLRTSDSHSFDTTLDTGHILQEMTPADFRAANGRESAERMRDADHPALPGVELCDTETPNFVQNIHSAPFDLNHDGSISREELVQTYRNPGVNQNTRNTAFALWDNFNQVTRLHDDWFNPNISENDLALLRHSPTDAPAASSINNEISFINQYGLDRARFLRRTFPTPEGP